MKRKIEEPIAQGTEKRLKLDKSGKVEKPPYSFKHCLNDIAWLCETSTASCASVCLVRARLIISDNLIYHSTEATEGIVHIEAVITYLSNMVNGTEAIDSNKQFIKNLCLLKFKGEEKGTVSSVFTAEELNTITAIFENQAVSIQNGSFKKISLDEHRDVINHSNRKLLHLLALGDTILRRLVRVIKFLKPNVSKLAEKDRDGGSQDKEFDSIFEEEKRVEVRLALSSIKQKEDIPCIRLSYYGGADYRDYGWVRGDQGPGCAILATHSKPDKGAVHTEMKIIDFLLAVRLLVGSNFCFIGISKKCCPSCDKVIGIINGLIGGEFIVVSDSHSQAPKKDNWCSPIFLLSPELSKFDSYLSGLWYSEKDQIDGYFVNEGQAFPIKKHFMAEQEKQELLKALIEEWINENKSSFKKWSVEQKGHLRRLLTNLVQEEVFLPDEEDKVLLKKFIAALFKLDESSTEIEELLDQWITKKEGPLKDKLEKLSLKTFCYRDWQFIKKIRNKFKESELVVGEKKQDSSDLTVVGEKKYMSQDSPGLSSQEGGIDENAVKSSADTIELWLLDLKQRIIAGNLTNEEYQKQESIISDTFKAFDSFKGLLAQCERISQEIVPTTEIKKPQKSEFYLAAYKEAFLYGENIFKYLTKQSDTFIQSEKALQANAANYGYSCENVPGDGNCFYHAAAKQLNNILKLDYTADKLQQLAMCLRVLACKHMEENRKIYEGFLDDNVGLKEQAQNGVWAEDTAITALCYALNINLILVRSDEKGLTIKKLSNGVCTLRLGYQVGLHYQSLFPCSDGSDKIKQTLLDDRFDGAGPQRLEAPITVATEEALKIKLQDLLQAEQTNVEVNQALYDELMQNISEMGEEESIQKALRESLKLAQEFKIFEDCQKKAEQGDMKAQYNLGVHYDKGDGVEQNEIKAFEYYQMAAQQGYAPAQYNLGVSYRDGIGVEQNTNMAMKFFELAANQNYSGAKDELERLKSSSYKPVLKGMVSDQVSDVGKQHLSSQKNFTLK